MGYSLFVIDGNKANIHKWDQKRKIPLNLNKIDRFFIVSSTLVLKTINSTIKIPAKIDTF